MKRHNRCPCMKTTLHLLLLCYGFLTTIITARPVPALAPTLISQQEEEEKDERGRRRRGRRNRVYHARSFNDHYRSRRAGEGSLRAGRLRVCVRVEPGLSGYQVVAHRRTASRRVLDRAGAATLCINIIVSITMVVDVARSRKWVRRRRGRITVSAADAGGGGNHTRIGKR